MDPSPDDTDSTFADEARRQSRLLAESDSHGDDQGFVDAISVFWGKGSELLRDGMAGAGEAEGANAVTGDVLNAMPSLGTGDNESLKADTASVFVADDYVTDPWEGRG